MFKVQINNSIIEDSTLSNSAFYLYVYLKLYARTKTHANIYVKDFMNLIDWKDKNTFKKYLQELKNKGLIEYTLQLNSRGYAMLPIHKPLLVKMEYDNLPIQFTQIKDGVLHQIREIASKTEIYSDHQLQKFSDEKEIATRIYYIYEKSYNKTKDYCIALTFNYICSIVKCSNKTLSSINSTLMNHHLLYIDYGKNKDQTVHRHPNKYTPIWKEERKILHRKFKKKKIV